MPAGAATMIRLSVRPTGGSKSTRIAATKKWADLNERRFTRLCQGLIVPAYIRAALRSPGATVATLDGADAAALLLTGRTDDELYITLICATAGGGHGRRLFEAIKAHAISTGKTSITLRAASTSLIGVYTRWGFARSDTPCGLPTPWLHTTYGSDGDDGYFMTMCLKHANAPPTMAQRFRDLAADREWY